MSVGCISQSTIMARGLRTLPPGTDDLLRQLNDDFQRSKTEQIQRFLVDQESLNRKFAEYHLNSDEDEDEGSGSSDTESVYSQRMALYKARPESVLGGVTLDQLFHTEEDAVSNTSTAACFSDSDEERGPAAMSAPYDRNLDRRGVVKAAAGRREEPEQQQPLPQEAAPVKKLLVRRHVRPRTATGITSVRQPSKSRVTALGDRDTDKSTSSSGDDNRLPPATSRLRASAPAASRTRPTLGDPIEKDHVVERSAARKTLLKESKSIASYRDAFGPPVGGKSTVVPDIKQGTDRPAPSYGRARAPDPLPSPRESTREVRDNLDKQDSRDPRSGISTGNTRLSQPRQLPGQGETRRSVHRVGSSNVSSMHNQRDSSNDSRASRASRTVLRMGEANAGVTAVSAGERRRDGFRGSTLRQTSRDRDGRDRSREKRSAGPGSIRSTGESEVVKLPPLEGGRQSRGAAKDLPV